MPTSVLNVKLNAAQSKALRLLAKQGEAKTGEIVRRLIEEEAARRNIDVDFGAEAVTAPRPVPVEP